MGQLIRGFESHPLRQIYFVNKHIDEFDETLLLDLEKFLNLEDEIILNYYRYDVLDKNIKENKILKIFKKYKI